MENLELFAYKFLVFCEISMKFRTGSADGVGVLLEVVFGADDEELTVPMLVGFIVNNLAIILSLKLFVK